MEKKNLVVLETVARLVAEGPVFPVPPNSIGTPHGPAVSCLGTPHPGPLLDPPPLQGSVWDANPRPFPLGSHRLLNPNGLTPESSSRAPSPGTLPSEDSHDFFTPSPGNPLYSEVVGAGESLALPKNLTRH